MATPPFENISSGILSGRSQGACLPNLKFVSLVILELLAFNAQKIRGHVTHVTLATPPLPSFNIRGLAAAKEYRLNNEPL